jgi:ATP-binding cassette subfamily B protein
MIIVFFYVSNKFHVRFKANQEAVSEINNQLEMTFSGIKVIKSFVCEKKYKRFFWGALENRYNTEYALVKTGTLLHLVYEYIDFFSMITIIIVGGYMVVKKDITIGTFYAFYTYLTMLIYPILDIPQLFVSGKQAFVCIDRLEEIKDFPVNSYNTDISTAKIDEKSSIECIDSIRFDNVSFKYENESSDNKIVLDNISFRVNKGEKILIMGSSGGGKTTILGLISGLLIPTNGDIYINEINIKDLNIESLRELMGYVPQEPSLFTGSIKENILFGINSIQQEVNDYEDNSFYKEIISIVQMKDEIDQFTEKDLTRIGQKGLSL